MVVSEEVDTFDVRDKLREVQRVCIDGGVAVVLTIVEMSELARDGVEIKRKNAALFNQKSDVEVKVGEGHAGCRKYDAWSA